MNKIAIVFWSGTGNTKAMADHIAQGVRAAGGEAELLGPGEFSADRLTAYSAVSFGCPAMGCEVLEEMEFEPMFAALEGSAAGGSPCSAPTAGGTASGCGTGATAAATPGPAFWRKMA